MIIGFLICSCIIVSCFYCAFIFVAVWAVQKETFIVAVFSGIAFDLLVLEIFFELIIALFFGCRKASKVAK